MHFGSQNVYSAGKKALLILISDHLNVVRLPGSKLTNCNPLSYFVDSNLDSIIITGVKKQLFFNQKTKVNKEKKL